MKKEGGRPVPDRIAIWLLRLVLLQLLDKRIKGEKCYYFDENGFRYYRGGGK